MDQSMEISDQENEGAMGPIRTPLQRKLIYRNLLTKVEELSESNDRGLNTVKEIGDVIKETNVLQEEVDISERVEYTDETLLDSMVLSSASDILVQTVKAVDVFMLKYDNHCYDSKMLEYMKGPDEETETPNWMKLLKSYHDIVRLLSLHDYFFATYDLDHAPVPKPKKVRQKQQKENLQKKQPKTVTNLEKEEKGMEEIVAVLYAVLEAEYVKNDSRPVAYYDYVIDTESFATTVENMFYCAFLVRDGKVHIDIDGQGTPFIRPVKKAELKRYREEEGQNAQMISTISIPQWQTLKTQGFLQKYKNRDKD